MELNFEELKRVIFDCLNGQNALKCVDGEAIDPSKPFGGPTAVQMLLDYGLFEAPILICAEENDEVSATMFYAVDGDTEKTERAYERYIKTPFASVIKVDTDAYKYGTFKLEYIFNAKNPDDLKAGIKFLFDEMGKSLFIECAFAMCACASEE